MFLKDFLLNLPLCICDFLRGTLCSFNFPHCSGKAHRAIKEVNMSENQKSKSQE